MKKISLKDIARMSGASTSTVSFVLNGKEREMRISSTLAEHIKKIAGDAGYEPNRVAVSLRTGKSNIIGLIVDTISGDFFATLARYIEAELDHHGYKVIYCCTGNDKKKGIELIRMLSLYQVDGFLITPSSGMEDELAKLLAHHKPLVLIDSFFSHLKTSYVLVDNYDGISKGINHLIEKGYRNIAFVYNDVALVQMEERKRAYKQTLTTHDIAVSEMLMLKTGYMDSKEKIIDDIKEFLAAQKPQAVLFAANYLGVYGLGSIKELGLKIPEDIAMVCFDDHDLFGLNNPGITAVRQPIKEIALAAVDMLMWEINNNSDDKPQRKVQIKATLQERASA